ncbi:MAG TPA: glycosyltransferase family 2 protein, partial [Candidatus Coprovivens excrementavium]|nr:glycosyltransferase family 2 protein [Candidatus Coprovivens excrementavium]
MGITFSFIIPTYNSKKTIIRAIESVTKQLDKSEYEIIIIDDGSQDGTVELVHDFMKDNGNIHFTSTIGGVSFARNKGINQAQGEYLLFLDSDDYYVEGSLKNLKNIVAQSNSDLVIFNFEHGNTPVLLAEVPNTNIEALSVMLSNPTKYMTVWGKAYRTETVHENNIRFNEDLKLSEDSEFLVRYVQKCKKITSDNTILYHYSIDNVSVMRGK